MLGRSPQDLRDNMESKCLRRLRYPVVRRPVDASARLHFLETNAKLPTTILRLELQKTYRLPIFEPPLDLLRLDFP